MQLEQTRLLGELAPGLVHDLRNMLNVVVGGAEAHLLDVVTTAAREASELADCLGRLSSLGAAPGRSAIGALDPNARLRTLMPLLARALPDSVALRLRLAPAAWPVGVNGIDLDAAILNLVLNARDAIPPGGGTIGIRTRNLWLAGTDDRAAAAYLALSVADDGRGMDRATLARACEPFFTTKGDRGTGLGLHQVRRFASGAGGWVHLRSLPGRGSIVCLYLPSASVPAGSIRAERAERPRRMPERAQDSRSARP